ncbi:hypothetical protein DAEQUDRAFT_331757 [Daedalea quercina L-15889]|uniref:C2H2-type domain-containing protein n=1 Tax=Daedalea quercina L-15889 TaxID=1314783 RepID=A0A165PLH0_9APHY|nr:hypothetical protein DAEQUDRAFT_331757 [Daedalea quercina L-15889]
MAPPHRLSGPSLMPYFDHGRSTAEPTVAATPIPSVAEDHAVHANEWYLCLEVREDGTVCNTSLCNRKGLEKHVKTVHHKGFQARCARCGEVFSRPDAVKRHNARVNCFDLQENLEGKRRRVPSRPRHRDRLVLGSMPSILPHLPTPSRRLRPLFIQSTSLRYGYPRSRRVLSQGGGTCAAKREGNQKQRSVLVST